MIEGPELPKGWVPGKAKRVVLRGRVTREQVSRLLEKQSPPRALQGRHDFLKVVFPDTSIPIPARLAKSSVHHDVALIKIDVPEVLHTLDMDDQHDVAAGDPVVVLGYPAISPNRFASIRSHDAFVSEAEQSVVPGLTVSAGNIGKVMIEKGAQTGFEDYIVSSVGDFYQLTVNSAGSGNSGGPVLNTHGKVVGIFYAFASAEGAAVSYAIPIKYGTELTKESRTVG
jgi:S1-C subfamily serine protease